MLKLNRKTEYGLLSLRYMSAHGEGDVTSVREIAQHYNIPEMILAKVLQRLKHGAMVASVKGSSGGYVLQRNVDQILLTEVFDLFKEQTNLVECLHPGDACECEQSDHCDIRGPMESLNRLILNQLEQLSVQDFFTLERSPDRPRNLSIYRHDVARA